MPEIPSFNYQNVYFFLMSLFGIIFILSLMDLIKVKNPMIITAISFINIFIGIFGWILQKVIDYEYEKYTIEHTSKHDLKEDLKWYRNWEIGIITTVTVITLFITAVAIILQR